MCIKVKCFTRFESKCLITNNKRRGPETVFVPARQTTYVGSEKMGKCGKIVNFTFDFVAFSNINSKDEYLALKGVSVSHIIYSNIFHSSTGFKHQREMNMHMILIVFEMEELVTKSRVN